MKQSIKSLCKGGAALLICLASLSACKNTFDIEPEDALVLNKAYQNVNDADAVIMGIYGKFLGLAEKYMVLNELRGDLEDVTVNADKYLREVSEHSVSANNPWADPRPWYEVIINCNDALVNFDKMLADKRMLKADYDQRYSEVGAIRSYIYLQLGIHYGSVPYVTDAIASIAEAQDQSKYPKISFEDLLGRLITFTEALPNLNPLPTSSTLVRTIDGYSTRKMFINKSLLLGDLHLWKGNYPQAAKYYKIVMEYGDVLYPELAGENWYNTYILGSNAARLSNENWATIFGGSFAERYSNYENIWLLPYDKRFEPVNPFTRLYAPTAGMYKIMPSAKAIKNWNDETRNDGSPVDSYRAFYSYRTYSWGPTIVKLIPEFSPGNPFATDGKWILYRAAQLHLRMGEAANRDGRDKIAYALMNLGLRNAYTPPGPVPTNVTNIQQSFDSNSDYYFDARQGETPRYRSKYFSNTGIRGRVSLPASKVDSTLYFDMSVPGNPNKAVTNREGLTIAMEDLLIKEAALELAFEGNRWQDLLRVALRREKEKAGSGKTFLQNTIAAKFQAANLPVPAGVQKLGASVENWYLPFNWE